MKYKFVSAETTGGPENLQIREAPLVPPKPGEVRIKVLAASVSGPDITSRSGKALYSGTYLGQKMPMIPGYSVIGDVDAVGDGVNEVSVGDRVGVLTVVGGYTEYLYWKSDRLIPVPESLHPGEAVPIILNYIVAWQVLHRQAKVSAGETALIIGASGGIGTALLQLGQLAGLKLYGVASAAKHDILEQYGAIPIDYRSQDFVEVINRAEPQGIDVVCDGMMRLEGICDSLSLLRRGGRVVSFGEPASRGELFRILGLFAGTNLLPNGKSLKLYGTSTYFLGDRKPFNEDWKTLFDLMLDGKIKPVVEQQFPILEAAKANEFFESGQVTGNVVLCDPEWL